MSIEQSVVNDVVDVKQAISDNWEDILATADSIEKLITDGLEWVQNPANQKTITDAFENVKNTIENDLDLSTIEQDFDQAVGSVEAELSQYLDPMLAQLKNIEADMNLEELFELIKNSMPNIPGLSEVTDELEDVLSPTKKILQELLKEGFSIKLKDLPLPAGATPSNAANGESSLFDVLTSGLDTHLDSVFTTHGDTIQGLLSNFFDLIDQDMITSLETNTKDLVSKFENGTIDTKVLMNSLKTLISKEGEIAKNIGQDFIGKTSNEIERAGTLLSDLLTEELDNEIFHLIRPNHTCTLISTVSLIIGIPLSLLDTSIDGKNRPILSVLKKSISQQKNEKDVAYGAMQLMDGFTMVFEILPDLIPRFDSFLSGDKQKPYLCFNLILSVCSFGFNIPAQVVSIPTTLSDPEKEYPSLAAQSRWQFGVWGFQWGFVGFAFFEIIIYIILLSKRPEADVYLDEWLEMTEPLNSNSTSTTTSSSSQSSTSVPPTPSPTQPSTDDKFGLTVTKFELGLALFELALEILHLMLFAGLNATEDNYKDKSADSKQITDAWKKALYYVDVVPGIIGNCCEIYRLYYDFNHPNLTEKPNKYRVSAVFEALIDFGCQMCYGGKYIDKGR